ncbi:POU domain, class 6, transcription factor 2 isoform X6 [Drosophila montana]|uniref:POU domain, class 6, transcription factor 2 isoform X6 n=1 Tax=Drosophila montana TaxID=40370 RepID=UPI00313D497A
MELVMQDMINLQKLQNLATLQQQQHQHQQQQQQHQQQQQQQQHPHSHHSHHHPATAAALASLQGLAASVFNSPLNLSVGAEAVTATTTAAAAAAGGVTSTSAAAAAATAKAASTSPSNSNNNNNSCHNGNKHKTSKGNSNNNSNSSAAGNSSSQQPQDNPSSSSSPHAHAHALNATTLANVLAAATASPPPALQAPPASAQMPQLILASGQLVQGVQGAQLLIPTAQGIAVQTILTIPVSPQIPTSEQFLPNAFGAFASYQQQQQQQQQQQHQQQQQQQQREQQRELLAPPLAALQHGPALPQLAQTPTNLLKPNLFSTGVQQLLTALHPELFAAAAANHQQQQREREREQQQQQLAAAAAAAAAASHLPHAHLAADMRRSAERTPPSGSPTVGSPALPTKQPPPPPPPAAAFLLQQQLHIKPETQTHLHHHHHLHGTTTAASAAHPQISLRHPDELTAPQLELKPLELNSSSSVSPPSLPPSAALARHHFGHNLRSAAGSSPKHSPGRGSSGATGMNLSQHHERLDRRSHTPTATATRTSSGLSTSSAASVHHLPHERGAGNLLSGRLTPTVSTPTAICSSSNERGYSSPLFRSHSPPVHALNMGSSPRLERDYLGNGPSLSGGSSGASAAATNCTATATASSSTGSVLSSINRLNASNGELTITKSLGPPTATATRASSASPRDDSPLPGPSTSGVSLMQPLKLSPSSRSEPPHLSPNGNDNDNDLLMDSPNEPTINQATTNVVDGIDLDEIKEFAKAFKLRRLSLGLTQTQVGQALSVTEGPAYSQSAICSSALAAQMYAAQLSTQQQNMFEKLDITPKSAQKIKPVLERWMKEAEESSHWNRYKSGQNHLTDYIGVEPSKKRKRRTSFTPQALELLNAHFERNTHPSGTEITGLAHQLGYEREVIRIWFCNKRQALKNTVRMMSKGMV